jgi:hypothetical protein
MNKKKNLPTAQETSTTSLGPCFVFVVWHCIRRLHLQFLSRPHRPPCHAEPPPFWLCCCASPSPSLSSSCGGCPRRRLPRRWSSSLSHRHCCHCRLSPRYQCRGRPVPLILSSWLPFLFIVAPSPSSPCQLLGSTPRAGACSGGMGVGVLSWRHLVVNNMDET